MYSSNPCLTLSAFRVPPFSGQSIHLDDPFDPHPKLLIQPDDNGGSLLQEPKDAVDGRKENALPLTTSAGHCESFITGTWAQAKA